MVVNSVSGWVCSKMGEVGSSGTSDIVKVMSVDPLSPVLNPWLVIPHYQFNKTKQHTHTHTVFYRREFEHLTV